MTISKGAFRHVESELYAYPETKREIERIRLELQYPYDDKPDEPGIIKGKNSVRQPGDPTGRTATLLVTNRKLEQLERIASVIGSVVDELPDEKKELMKLWYWSHPRTLTWDGVAMKLGISRRTAINWRNEIVYVIASKIGWR